MKLPERNPWEPRAPQEGGSEQRIGNYEQNLCTTEEASREYKVSDTHFTNSPAMHLLNG